MRKLKSKIKQKLKKTYSASILLIVLISVSNAYQISPYVYVLFGLTVFSLWALFKSGVVSSKYVNEAGYVVIKENNELEHRYIAKRLLERDLRKNEVVHHINGNKLDNELRNLCLMDREKHEHFHAWLKWKKKKSGRYPSFREQKRILVSDYGGMLLKSRHDLLTSKKSEQNSVTQLSDKLFEELRKLRRELARSENVPAYRIFSDKTLLEMAKYLPVTSEEMKKISGVGFYKFNKYSSQFIDVIKSFKDDYNGKNSA